MIGENKNSQELLISKLILDIDSAPLRRLEFEWN